MQTDTAGFRRLQSQTLKVLALGTTLIVLCYFFVDRPVAFAAHNRNHLADAYLQGITLVPPIVQAWVPVLLIALMVRRTFGPLRRWEQTLCVAGVAVVLADQFKESLAYVAGRYWPETWVDHNPSLIGDGAYGFHPFHSGSWYGSFPSGHTARTLAFVAVFSRVFPWSRWPGVLASLAVAVALVGMNYHFVSDVIAGGLVGYIIGVYAVSLAGLEYPPASSPPPP
jgi:membrane-associated phospholipid phosphatase